MESNVKEYFNNLKSTDDKVRLAALRHVLEMTEGKVDWVYEVWDDLVRRLDDGNSYQRSIAIMVLSNLAKSDSQGRLAVPWMEFWLTPGTKSSSLRDSVFKTFGRLLY